MTTQATIKTPVELNVPVKGVNDHGLTLVHELGGTPRNYLHEVSASAGNTEAQNYLLDAGYRQSHGYRVGGRQWWVWAKRFPLSVGTW